MTESGLQLILYLLKVASCKMTLFFFQLINDIKPKYNESNTFIIKNYKLCVSFMMFNSVLKQKLAKTVLFFHYFNKNTK